jgi:hypothetical protein
MNSKIQAPTNSYRVLFNHPMRVALFLGWVFLSSCATTERPKLETEKFFSDEKALHKEWVTRKNKETKQASEPQIGLALAGGGTRAAQYAIGVLEGLYRSGVLEHVDVISSVSGGGYAAYGYFSNLLATPDNTRQARQNLFEDCIPQRYKVILGMRGSKLLCEQSNRTNVVRGEEYTDPYRWQNNLRGHADLFTSDFNYDPTTEDDRFLLSAFTIAMPQILLSLATEPLTDIAFDWNVDADIPWISSRHEYREGIRSVWSLPVNCGMKMNSKTGSAKEKGECWDTRPLDTEKQDITFQQLRKAYARENNDIPFWIINATTPVLDCDGTWYEDPGCTVLASISSETYPPHKAGFEITPYHWGSGEHGHWDSCAVPGCQDQDDTLANKLDTHGLKVIDAVAAAAAFFDPYEKTVNYVGIPYLFQKAAGFRWGYYIPNPTIQSQTPWERYVHRALPFPLYLAHGWQEKRDAMDIHLIDGGQNENLGAIPLIRRRIPNIIISDHSAEENWGTMEDICNMKKWLRNKSFSGESNKIWHIHIDALPDLEQVCSSDGHKHYNIYAWNNPVLKGCAIELNASDYPQGNIPEAKRCDEWQSEKSSTSNPRREFLSLYVVKPAINFNDWIAKLDCMKQGSQDFDSCLSNTSDEELRGNAEILGFLMKNAYDEKKGGFLWLFSEGILFPRHETVALSIDSSAWLLGAYRELGALAASKLALDANGNLRISTQQTDQHSEPSEQIIKKIKNLTGTFQKKKSDFCKNKSNPGPLC